MKYLIMVHKSKYGYDTHVPALPGCHSQGSTEKEALRNTKDAVLTYLEMSVDKLNNVKMRELEVAFA